jgi:hypothetical protein
MRVCRGCGQLFRPEKPYYHYCTWACRRAHARQSGAYGDAWQKGYHAGFRDGVAQVQQQGFMPPAIWRALMSVAHPDRYQGSPLAMTAHKATVWLIQHRPGGRGRG